MKATLYVNVTDSMLVLDDGDEVLLDANDALHASPPHVIDHFCELLHHRHPRVDTLFLGFSGASWFPNCMRLPGKEDREVARGRERLFADNFIRVVDQLQPKVACAFAASFVLAEPHNHWINESEVRGGVAGRRLSRREARRTHAGAPAPAQRRHRRDRIVSGLTTRPTPAALEQALETVLRPARERVEHLEPLGPGAVRTLVAQLETRVQANIGRLRKRKPFSAEIRLRDNPHTVLRHRCRPQRRACVAWSGALSVGHLGAALRDPRSRCSTRTTASSWNIVIGYGAVATLKIRRHTSTSRPCFSF